MPRGRPRKRSSRRKKRASSAPPVIESPKKRLKWSNESMVKAIDAVRRGCTIKRAAVEHGIPRTTLQDRISGKVQHGIRPGPKPYLTEAEEGKLVEFLEVVAEVGYGKTRKQVMNIAESTARDKGILRKKKISDGWFRRFIERQPNLSLRKGDRTAFVRMDAMNRTAELDNYFITLKSILVDNDLMDKPGQIYNVDESGMPLEHRSPCVLAKKGQRKVRYCTSGNKSQVTVVACINATGHCLPPFIIYDAKNLNMDWTKGEVPGTTYGRSDSGWIDLELFKLWFFKHFLCHAVSSRPLLLLLDGHSSHYSLEVVELAKENEVIIFTLVPHTTHEMQPLDTAVFGPLKNNWQEACHMFIQNHPGRVITKYQFNEIFSPAWLKSMAPANAISGFKACGIYPFNPKAVLDHNPCEPKRSEPTTPHSSDVAQCNSSQTGNSVQCGSSTADNISHGIADDDNHDIADDSNYGIEDPFTPEEEARFLIRYNENYDLPDPRYQAWLRLNHLEENCQELGLTEHFHDLVPLDPIAISPTAQVCMSHRSTPSSQSIYSLSGNPEAVITGVTPGLTPSRSCNTSPKSILSSVTTHPISSIIDIIPSSTTSVISCSTDIVTSPTSFSSSIHPISTETITTPSSISSHFSHSSNAISQTAVSNNSPRTPPVCPSISCAKTSSQSSTSVTDVISKYLVQYVSPLPAKKGTTTTRVTGSRVLTSAQGYAILQEKEEKKKKEKEEKERRKQERIEKKREREELAKKKAEEKEELAKKKAEEKEELAKKKAKEKEELARKKAEEKAKKTSQRQRQSKRSGNRLATSRSMVPVEVSSSASNVSSTATISEVGTSTSFVCMDDTHAATEQHSSTTTITPSDQDYQCCECFGTFEDDIMLGNEAEWAQCGCGRWIHEDCISETAMDESGRPRICSNCVM